MTMRGAEHERGGLSGAFARITDGLARLLSEHLALARVELREDVRALAMDLARIAVFVPLILVGHGLLCGALAVLVARWTGIGWALAAVGGANVLVGGVGAWTAARRLQRRQVLETTRLEMNRTTATLATVVRPNGAEKRLGA